MGSAFSKGLLIEDAAAKTAKPEVPFKSSGINPDLQVANLHLFTASGCSRCHSKTTGISIKWCPSCDKPLCTRCLKSHRRNPRTCRHPTLDLTDTNRTVEEERRYAKCDRHNQDVNLFCNNCKNAICSGCREQQHRRCISVVVLDSKYSEMRLYLLKQKAELKMQIELREALRGRMDTNGGKLLVMYQEQSESIDKTLNSGSNCMADICHAYLSCVSGQISDMYQATVPPKISDTTFTTDIAIIMKARFINKSETTNSNHVIMSDLRRKISTREETGEEINILCDIKVVVADGYETAVVSDLSNRCLKSFHAIGNEVYQSKLDLDGRPHGIAILLDQQVMVALPGTKQIVRVQVIPDLILLATIKTKKKYTSLALLSPLTIAAGSWKCIHILDMCGYLLRSIKKYNGADLIGRPWYMCTNRGNLLVSDWEKRCVICLTQTGEVVWRYPRGGNEGLKNPLGITTTSTGDVLLSDWSENTVIKLTESGEFKNTVLSSQDGVHKIRGLYMGGKNTLFVCGLGQVNQPRLKM